MKFDVVIVSNRHYLLTRQIKRIKNLFPYNKIIVIDSTGPPFRFNIDQDVEYYNTPNAKLGYARQKGLEVVNTPFFFMVDDDISFKKGTAEKLFNAMIKYSPTVFAMSPVILFGENENILSVYKRKTKDTEGVSTGFCIMRKQAVNHIGGFNVNVHIGEDAELFYRAKKYKYRWIRKHDVFVNHPGTDVDFIFRPWKHREGKMTAIAYGIDTYHGTIIKRIRGILTSLLSLIKYRNIRTTMFFVSQDLIHILAFIRGIIGGKNYALHKTKIV